MKLKLESLSSPPLALAQVCAGILLEASRARLHIPKPTPARLRMCTARPPCNPQAASDLCKLTSERERSNRVVIEFFSRPATEECDTRRLIFGLRVVPDPEQLGSQVDPSHGILTYAGVVYNGSFLDASLPHPRVLAGAFGFQVYVGAANRRRHFARRARSRLRRAQVFRSKGTSRRRIQHTAKIRPIFEESEAKVISVAVVEAAPVEQVTTV